MHETVPCAYLDMQIDARRFSSFGKNDHGRVDESNRCIAVEMREERNQHSGRYPLNYPFRRKGKC